MRVAVLTLVLGLAIGGCAPASPPAVPRPAAAARSPAAVPLHTDARLQAAIDSAASGFRGVVGVYALRPGTGESAALRADERFPTASMIKLPLLVKLIDEVEQGRLDLERPLVFHDSLRYADDDLAGKLKEGEPLPLWQLAHLMVSISDNTASLWIQALVGGGAAVNEWLEGAGFEHTRVNSRTPGRRGDWERYGWGQTTPREMAELLTAIRDRRAVSPAASERMHRMLSRNTWDRGALAPIPPAVATASKEGNVDRSRSEAVLVHAPAGDYVLCVITRDQEDTRYAADNEGETLIREISRLVWERWGGEADLHGSPPPG